MSAPLLELEHVAVAFGAARPLVDVNLEVGPGELVAIVGETGSGKSLSCRVALGMTERLGGRVVSGRVRFRGDDVTALGERGWRRLRGREIGFVPQASIASLYPLGRVGGQLKAAARMLDPESDPEERALELLRQVHLPDPTRVMEAYPHELSGGMRQRVMIALALVGRPAVLIADEATTALDVTVQGAILELLRELRASTGMSIVFVTHDLGVVQELCSRVYVMYGGEMMEVGRVADVMSAPSHPYTRALVSADVRHAEVGVPLPVIQGMPPDPAHRPPGCPFAPRCAHALTECSTREVVLGAGVRTVVGQETACWRAREGEVLL
ncbi:MAG TPA: ABC transporter ATP-binding protein [Solirubrobacterales bacterium]|nr:ABC transporter ATP-binding protein [Solirubrobacterales bacterium]